MIDDWIKRSRQRGNGTVEVWHERPVPGRPGVVEQSFSGTPDGATSVRSVSTPSVPKRWPVELTDRARADILRELSEWDGREQGGALVGRIESGRVVIEHAGGLGVGLETKRGIGWINPPLTRYVDFATSWRSALVGEWHTHPVGNPPRPSSDDLAGWERVRAVLEAPVVVGLIVAPRRSVALGLTPWQDEETWAWTGETVAVYAVTADGCNPVPPPTR